MIEIGEPVEERNWWRRWREERRDKKFAEQFDNQYDYAMALWDLWWPYNPFNEYRKELYDQMPETPRGFQELKRRIFEA